MDKIRASIKVFLCIVWLCSCYRNPMVEVPEDPSEFFERREEVSVSVDSVQTRFWLHPRSRSMMLQVSAEVETTLGTFPSVGYPLALTSNGVEVQVGRVSVEPSGDGNEKANLVAVEFVMAALDQAREALLKPSEVSLPDGSLLPYCNGFGNEGMYMMSVVGFDNAYVYASVDEGGTLDGIGFALVVEGEDSGPIFPDRFENFSMGTASVCSGSYFSASEGGGIAFFASF